jgi:predicted GIY-YIG superfamily endonuclease
MRYLAVPFSSMLGNMDPAFTRFVEMLHPSFERLMQMVPLKMSALPSRLPEKCIYLLSEGQDHFYVGRTRKLRNRLRQHSIVSAQHNQAVFAFKLAREATGQLIATYSAKGSRKAMCVEPLFAHAFTQAKTKVRNMDLRFVEEDDPTRPALLEIYASVVLGTKYNDFDTY